jgi:hypothetical protein
MVGAMVVEVNGIVIDSGFYEIFNPKEGAILLRL